MSFETDITLDDLPDLLDHLDADMEYARWSKIGRALFSQFGSLAKDAFQQWSSLGSSYKASEFNTWWRNFERASRTSFGSFIYELKQAGWRPEKKQYSDEDRAERAKRIEQAKITQQQKAIAAEKAKRLALVREHAQFLLMQPYLGPSKYFLKKHMADANRFIDLRQGRDKFGNHFVAWPIWSKVGNTGDFMGFERLVDKKGHNKFASDNAYTNQGFATFGSVENLTRIFVVGGFADAYSAHKATGETIVTPIGESNIPHVIQLIREQLPHIQIIAAPDNDKQGDAVIKEYGGPWTLPAAAGADWSDVWLQEGAEALKQQMLFVRGFESIQSETRYLSAKIRTGLNLLKSGMGTGKTQTVIRYIADNPHDSVLVISHRRSLAKGLRAGINKVVMDGGQSIDIYNTSVDSEFHYYEEQIIKGGAEGVDTNAALRASKRLVCSVDSLWRLAGAQFDIIFFDEIEQGIGHFYAETNRHAENCLHMLQFLLTHSKTQILADAHLGELTLDFCRERLGLHTGVFFENTYKVGKGRKLFVYENKNHLTEVFTQNILRGQQAYVYCNSKRDVKNLATSVRQLNERDQWYGELLEIHAESVKDNVAVISAIDNINAAAPNLDVLIASPTLGTGFDIVPYDKKTKQGHRFAATYGFLTSKVGTSEEGHQGLNRAREVSEYHVYVDPTERNEPTDPQYIYQKLIEEVSQETASILKIDPQTGSWVRTDALYERLYAQVRAQQNLSKNNYRARFIQLAKEDGYEVVEIAKNELACEFGKVTREEASHRNDRQLIKQIGEAELHTGADYDAMIANSENISPIEYSKSRVCKSLNLTAANESQLRKLLPLATTVYNEFKQNGDNHHLNPEADAPILIPDNTLTAVINAVSFLQEKNHFANKIAKLSLLSMPLDNTKELDKRNITNSLSRAKWEHKSIRKRHLMTVLAAAGINERLYYNGTIWSKELVQERLAQWMNKNREALFKYSGTQISDSALADPVQWFNGHLRACGVPVIPLGQRRINGKVMRCYGVDEEQWQQVQTLIQLRNDGIAEYLAANNEESANDAINARDAVTPRPTVINNQIGEGVTLAAHQFNSAVPQIDSLDTEGEGHSTHTVKHSSLLDRVIDLAVNVIKLPVDYVNELINSDKQQWIIDINATCEGLQHWALTIRDLYLFDCPPTPAEYDRLAEFRF